MPDITPIICKMLLFQVRSTVLKNIVLTSNFGLCYKIGAKEIFIQFVEI